MIYAAVHCTVAHKTVVLLLGNPIFAISLKYVIVSTLISLCCVAMLEILIPLDNEVTRVA